MDKFLTIVGAFVFLAIIVILVGLLLAWPMSLLWNGCLVPAVAGLSKVGILQMWGINVLFGFWFKSTSF